MTTQTLSRPIPSHGKVTEPCVDHTADPLDISDTWASEVENVTGAEVFAFFDHNVDHGQVNPTFRGLRITEDGDTTYTTEFGGIDLLGIETITRIEAAYSEQVQS